MHLQGDLLMRDLLQQTLAALAAVHARNATHRDIKPENLLLSHSAPADTGKAPARVATSDNHSLDQTVVISFDSHCVGAQVMCSGISSSGRT